MINDVIRYVRLAKNIRVLRRNAWLKRSELERIQQKKLRAIIKHAYQNVPFYHKLFDSVGVKPDDIKTVDDLSKIPIITKSQVQRAGNEIIAEGIDINKCEKHHTSGSTGVPLTIVYYKDDLALLDMVQERTYIENGRRFRDSIARISTRHQTQDKSLLKYLGLRKINYLSVFDNISDQIRLLKRIKPDILNGYPSSIKLLAMAVREKEIKGIEPRLIFSFAELLDTETRNLINSVFGVTMFDYYGSMEAGVMAWECKEHSGYHMNIDSLVMEFIKDGERVAAGERGEIVITSLNLHAMPFIRYRIGDIGISKGEKCPCGRGLPLMDMIEGRTGDFVKVLGGRIFSPMTFYFLRNFSEIAQYQIIQEKEDRITIKVVKGPGFSENTLHRAEAELKNILGDNVQIEPKIVKEIPKEKSGKLRYVVSKINVFD